MNKRVGMSPTRFVNHHLNPLIMKPLLLLFFLSCTFLLYAQEGKENYFLTGLGVRLDYALNSRERTYNVHLQYTRTLNRWFRYSVRSEFSVEDRTQSDLIDAPGLDELRRLDVSGFSPSALEGVVEHDDPNPGIAQFERVYRGETNFTTTFYMGFSPIYTKRFQIVLSAGPHLRYRRDQKREASWPFKFEHADLESIEGEYIRTHWIRERRELSASINLNTLFAYTLKERYVFAFDSTWRLYTADDYNGAFDGFGTDGLFTTIIFGIKF